MTALNVALLLLGGPISFVIAGILLCRIAPKKDACHTCGYALTGLPPDARCPECGQIRANDSTKQQFKAITRSCGMLSLMTLIATWIASFLLWSSVRRDSVMTFALFSGLTPFVTIACACAFTVLFAPCTKGRFAWLKTGILPLMAGMLSLTITGLDAADTSNEFQGMSLFYGSFVTLPALGFAALMYAIAHWRAAKRSQS